VKTVILAGGRGTRLAEETHAIPKPMVTIGERPILWHIMQHYAAYGHADFVVALGYKGYVIKEYFANQLMHSCDMAVDLTTGSVEYLSRSQVDWKVTLIDTGAESMTGGRIKRLAGLLTERFLLTYGDGLSDVPIDAVVAHHEAVGAAATVTAVHPPPRFGSLGVEDGMVADFREKPQDSHDWINGGYFVVEPDVLDLIEDDTVPFEAAPLSRLAQQGRLGAYQHEGFWMPMDTVRERDELNKIWNSGNAPWWNKQ
jgi:glucose-1-phosphate cytidylyltransferase